MGYQYLVKIEKNADLYLLVDGRNDCLMHLGSRGYFETDSVWKNYVYAEMFEKADAKGSTDSRMFWEDSTYITFDNFAVTRKTLSDFVTLLDDRLEFDQSRDDLYLPNDSFNTFGGINYPELVIGAERVGIPRDNLDMFLDALHREYSASEFDYTSVDGIALFHAASLIAKKPEDILMWAAAIAVAVSGSEAFNPDAIPREVSGRFLYLMFQPFEKYEAEDVYHLLMAFGHDNSGLMMAFADEEEVHDLKAILRLFNAGVTGQMAIRRALRHSIDADLMTSLHAAV